MHGIRIEGLPTTVAERVRSQRADDHGNSGLQPILVDESPGYLCRHCLRDPNAGEMVYLFSYSPFIAPRPYRSVGPIFVHATVCDPYDRAGEVPKSLGHRLLSVRAYRSDDFLVAADVVQGRELEGMIERFFGQDHVAYVDIHNARPGCFVCRAHRS